MKPQSTVTFSSQSKLSIHRESHAISKPKPPTVRIIHIFDPEIINTNVENFRELVQRLTGKPDQEKSKATKSSMLPPKQHTINQCSKQVDQDKKRRRDDAEIPAQLYSLKKMKKESEEMYGSDNLNNGYFHGFGDMDCFNINDLVDDYPLLPFKSSSMNMFSEISHYAN